MAVFEYKGIQVSSGKPVKGYRDAENPRALRLVLRKDGILLTSAQEDSGKKAAAKRKEIDLLAPLRRVSTADVAVMTRQLATLVRAGIPLVESIGALIDQLEKEQFVRVMSEVQASLKAGTSFAKSLEQHPRVFPPLYVNMVAAGEASGMLEAVLERLADFMEGQARLKGKVMAALAYPVLMLVFGTGIVGLLMVTVVPKVTTIFDNLGHALPWYTRLLIFTSDFVSGFWWLLIAVAVGGGGWFRDGRRTPGGGLRWARVGRRFPVSGRLPFA